MLILVFLTKEGLFLFVWFVIFEESYRKGAPGSLKELSICWKGLVMDMLSKHLPQMSDGT